MRSVEICLVVINNKGLTNSVMITSRLIVSITRNLLLIFLVHQTFNLIRTAVFRVEFFNSMTRAAFVYLSLIFIRQHSRHPNDVIPAFESSFDIWIAFPLKPQYDDQSLRQSELVS